MGTIRGLGSRLNGVDKWKGGRLFRGMNLFAGSRGVRWFLMVMACTLGAVVQGQPANDGLLDEYLDERIELNEFYRDKNVKQADELRFANDIKPIEREIGQEWVDFLRHVRASKDRKLKIHTLRLEFLEEMRGCGYNLEDSGSVSEANGIRGELKAWRTKLEAVNKVAATPVAKPVETPAATVEKK